MKARDVMSSPPFVVAATETVARAADLMRAHDVGFVPVVEDRLSMRLAGVLTDRDVAVRHVAPGHGANCGVIEHMTMGDLVTVDAELELGRVIDLMAREHVRRVAVTQAGRLVGVISVGDVARTTAHRADVPALLAKLSEPAGSGGQG